MKIGEIYRAFFAVCRLNFDNRIERGQSDRHIGRINGDAFFRPTENGVMCGSNLRAHRSRNSVRVCCIASPYRKNTDSAFVAKDFRRWSPYCGFVPTLRRELPSKEAENFAARADDLPCRCFSPTRRAKCPNLFGGFAPNSISNINQRGRAFNIFLHQIEQDLFRPPEILPKCLPKPIWSRSLRHFCAFVFKRSHLIFPPVYENPKFALALFRCELPESL